MLQWRSQLCGQFGGGSRNSYHHGEAQYQRKKSVELVEELLKALEVPALSNVVVPTEVPRWKPPEAGWIKVNTDGAVDFVNGRAGAGMIVRDDQGQFIRAK